MSRRWQPKKGEKYWMVNEIANAQDVVWWDDKFDREFYEIGNCFKTKAEAEAAAEKVRALLLSLHEPTTECSQLVANCNQLPKLTTEVFDRPDCPEWAKYAAVDRDGMGRVFESEPMAEEDGWYSFGTEKQAGGGKYDASDWQNSLVGRPAKENTLPEWCKVGEWVYNTVYKEYVQISDIDEFEVSLKDGAYCSMGIKSFLEDCRQARLRPYNADEMRSLVGKVVTTSSGRHCTLVTACKQEYSSIQPQVMLNKWLYATDLLNGGNTIDGKPAGVFEHLENGEWQE